MFGKRSNLRKDHEGIVKEINEGKRRQPIHDRPTSLRENAFKTFITPAHDLLFNDFDWFGGVLNWQVRGPWSVEEMRDTLLRDGDSPDLGRRYKIFYNNIDMGTLEIGLGFEGLMSATKPEEFKANPSARAVLNLNFLRFVPYDDAFILLSQLELLLGSVEEPKNSERVDAARARASILATASLARYLWEAFRNEDDYVPEFEHRTEGPYVILRDTIAHWKSNGFDPFAWPEEEGEDEL